MMEATPMHLPENRARQSVRFLLALASLLLLASCAHFAASPAAAESDEIRRQRQEFNQLVAYRKMVALGALVGDDVQLITPARVIKGRKELVRSFETLVHKRPDLVSVFTTDRVERNPRWKFASESGHWSESWQQNGEAVELRGSYHALWKLKDGRWRIHAQIVTPVSCQGTKYCKSQEP